MNYQLFLSIHNGMMHLIYNYIFFISVCTVSSIHMCYYENSTLASSSRQLPAENSKGI